MKECLKPNSLFVATFSKGDDNYSGEKWSGQFVPYTTDRITQMVNEAGLKCHPTDWTFADQPVLLITLPESEMGLLEGLPDLNLLGMLKLEREYAKTRLRSIERHPYVKLGIKVKRIIRGLNKRLRR